MEGRKPCANLDKAFTPNYQSFRFKNQLFSVENQEAELTCHSKKTMSKALSAMSSRNFGHPKYT